MDAAAVLLAVLGLVALAWWYATRKPQPIVAGIPLSPHHTPFLGVAPLLKEVIGALRVLCVDSANEDGLSSFYLIGQPVVSVLKAEHVRTVLLASNYRSQISMWQKHLDQFLGPKAIVTLMHDEWRAHRRLMTSAFHWQSLRAMIPTFCRVANGFADRLAGSGEAPVELSSAMKLATLDAIGLTAFGFSFNTVRDGRNRVAEAFEFLLDEVTRRQTEGLFEPSSLIDWLPTEANKRWWAEVKVLRSTVDNLVRTRLQQTAEQQKGGGSAEVHEDLLKHMIDASREDGQLTAQSLSDNLLTFMFGGFDTTSIALAYTFRLIATHPEVEAKALAEIKAVLGPADDPSYETLQQLPYCQAVLTEALRLYPPAPLTVRTLEEDLSLEGGRYRIPKGTIIYIPIWRVHRYPPNWGDDAEEFRPERHLAPAGGAEGGAGKSATSYRFVAFSGGQRNCIGQRFAMLEATVLFAIILRRCRFELPEGAPPLRSVSTGIVQKPEGGCWVHVRPRA